MIVIAKQMLLFPVAYTILILPVASLRFTEWAGHGVAFESVIFCGSILMLSGLVHVILFLTTRRILSDEAIFDGALNRPRLAQTESFFFGPDSFTNISDTLAKSSGTSSKGGEPPSMIQRAPSFDMDIEKELSAMESYEVVGVLTAPKVAKGRHSRGDSRRHSTMGSISIPAAKAKHNSRRVSYQVGTSENDRYTVPGWANKPPPAGVPNDVNNNRETIDGFYDLYDGAGRSPMEEIKLSGPKGEPQEVFVVLSPRLNGGDGEMNRGFRF